MLLTKLTSLVRPKTKLSQKAERDVPRVPTLNVVGCDGKAELEEPEPESTIARPAELLSENQAFLSQIIVPLESTYVIFLPKEHPAERLIREYDGGPQQISLWATRHEKGKEITLRLQNGNYDAVPNRFRRSLNFAIPRDDFALLLQCSPTIRGEDHIPSVVANIDYLKLLVKYADPSATKSYYSGLSLEDRKELLRTVIERRDIPFLNRILHLIKETELRDPLGKDLGFMIMAGDHAMWATVAVQTYMKHVHLGELEKFATRCQERVPPGVTYLTLTTSDQCASLPSYDDAKRSVESQVG
ncbi:MAG: hypothetical protein Q9220_006390 [cf. Caloplaca sp. 1 TL-2023]